MLLETGFFRCPAHARERKRKKEKGERRVSECLISSYHSPDLNTSVISHKLSQGVRIVGGSNMFFEIFILFRLLLKAKAKVPRLHHFDSRYHVASPAIFQRNLQLRQLNHPIINLPLKQQQRSSP